MLSEKEIFIIKGEIEAMKAKAMALADYLDPERERGVSMVRELESISEGCNGILNMNEGKASDEAVATYRARELLGIEYSGGWRSEMSDEMRAKFKHTFQQELWAAKTGHRVSLALNRTTPACKE